VGTEVEVFIVELNRLILPSAAMSQSQSTVSPTERAFYQAAADLSNGIDFGKTLKFSQEWWKVFGEIFVRSPWYEIRD